MCVYSMIGDHYNDKWREQYPWAVQPVTDTNINVTYPPVSREEFDELKKDVKEMKELLKRAKIYDAEHGQPDCQIEEKIALLRRVAELVGIDLGDVL